MSPAIPSGKNACPGSPDMSSKGKAAIDGPSGKSQPVGAATGTASRTMPDIAMPTGRAIAFSRAATLTPSPWMSSPLEPDQCPKVNQATPFPDGPDECAWP